MARVRPVRAVPPPGEDKTEAPPGPACTGPEAPHPGFKSCRQRLIQAPSKRPISTSMRVTCSYCASLSQRQ